MLEPIALAAALAAAPETCTCAATFDAVVEATEEHYAGYLVKLPDEAARSTYRRFTGLLRADAAGARPGECKRLLDAYTGFFADHHLFVMHRSDYRPAIPDLKGPWDEAAVQRAAAAGPAPAATLEGVWYDGSGKVGIVRDAALPPGRLAAVRLDGEDRDDVVALLTLRHGRLRADYLQGDWGWQNAEASLHRDGTLLAFGTRALGRAGALRLHPDDPQRPILERLADGVEYLSMPSFMPRYRAPLQEILEQHGERLAAARGLVIDVRGNAGGDAIYFPLADHFLANEIRLSEPSSLRASSWTLEYFQGFRERLGERGAWLDPVLEAMRENPGGIVEYRDGSAEGLPEYPARPETVLVLQDGGVGSAAEAFVYHARQSTKVVTLGEPTRGNIDYMQVSMHRLGCGDHGVWFGYPLYFKRALPEGSIDDEGYPPDVRLPPEEDWIEFAKRWILDGHEGRRPGESSAASFVD